MLVKPQIPALFNEAGVTYSYDEASEKEYGFKRFQYGWVHNPTGNKGLHYVYVSNLPDLEKLIAFWNRNTFTDTWRYKVI